VRVTQKEGNYNCFWVFVKVADWQRGERWKRELKRGFSKHGGLNWSWHDLDQGLNRDLNLDICLECQEIIKSLRSTVNIY
jgi:hypothetical protein